MATCVLCKGKKSKRLCPAIDNGICPVCCGVKRGIEIECPEDCSFYIQGRLNENEKSINILIRDSFNDEYNDLYKKEEVCNVVGPFETFLLSEYYSDTAIKDDNIYQCLLKIYYTLCGQGKLYKFNEVETTLLKKYKEVVKDNSTPAELQKTIVLRLMKSVKNLTGGYGGNRNYLESLRGQFYKTGNMAKFFE